MALCKGPVGNNDGARAVASFGQFSASSESKILNLHHKANSSGKALDRLSPKYIDEAEFHMDLIS